MRLPTDVTLLIGEGADPQLEQIWHAERLPVVSLALGLDQLEAALEAIGTATVLSYGEGAREAATFTVALGFRTFLICDYPTPEGVHAASLDQAIEAARNARARERWKAGRVGKSK